MTYKTVMWKLNFSESFRIERLGKENRKKDKKKEEICHGRQAGSGMERGGLEKRPLRFLLIGWLEDRTLPHSHQCLLLQ